MPSSSAAAPTEPKGPPLHGPALPPVEAPTATFILQLFLIPLLIVSIVVAVWLLFSWVAHMDRDNAAELVKSIERGDQASGQLAFELAGLLRSPDPKYDALRSDGAIAKRLATFLDRDLNEPAGGDEKRIMRRMYLCRAIGEFRVPDGLPVLLRAAKEERNPPENDVRYAALEAIATLAHNMGPESFAEQNRDALEAVLTASHEQDDSAAEAPLRKDGTPTIFRPKAELRAVAAYTLGVIGGEEANERLRRMLHDPYPNARYNAATGLARVGGAECIGVLREMLDPENEQAIKDERNPNDQARKRTTVLLNGIKAALHLAEVNPRADLAAVRESLKKLSESPLENVPLDRNKVKSAAVEVLRLMSAEQAVPRS
jgi:HEAT repeat protein